MFVLGSLYRLGAGLKHNSVCKLLGGMLLRNDAPSDGEDDDRPGHEEGSEAHCDGEDEHGVYAIVCESCDGVPALFWLLDEIQVNTSIV